MESIKQFESIFTRDRVLKNAYASHEGIWVTASVNSGDPDCLKDTPPNSPEINIDIEGTILLYHNYRKTEVLDLVERYAETLLKNLEKFSKPYGGITMVPQRHVRVTRRAYDGGYNLKETDPCVRYTIRADLMSMAFKDLTNSQIATKPGSSRDNWIEDQKKRAEVLLDIFENAYKATIAEVGSPPIHNQDGTPMGGHTLRRVAGQSRSGNLRA